MKAVRSLVEILVSFVFYSALVALSLYLQEPISMSDSAAVVILGGGCVFGFLFVVVGRASSIYFFLGAFLAGLWFPLIFTLIEISYWREISVWRSTLAFFSCLRSSEVAVPMGSFVGAAGCGVLLGLIVQRTRQRATVD